MLGALISNLLSFKFYSLHHYCMNSIHLLASFLLVAYKQENILFFMLFNLNLISSTGTSSPSSSYPYQLKKNHGALNIFGWGVLLPIGAIIARYCKQWDPLWFYLHVSIQFFGFIIGLAGIVCGIALYNKLHSSVSAHRGLGIFVFVLGILQVSELDSYNFCEQ